MRAYAYLCMRKVACLRLRLHLSMTLTIPNPDLLLIEIFIACFPYHAGPGDRVIHHTLLFRSVWWQLYELIKVGRKPAAKVLLCVYVCVCGELIKVGRKPATKVLLCVYVCVWRADQGWSETTAVTSCYGRSVVRDRERDRECVCVCVCVCWCGQALCSSGVSAGKYEVRCAQLFMLGSNKNKSTVSIRLPSYTNTHTHTHTHRPLKTRVKSPSEPPRANHCRGRGFVQCRRKNPLE